jgi:flagellar capping protein FliD
MKTIHSDQYNELFNNFTNQIQIITDNFNNQISGLRNSITLLPTYPFSANNVNYVDISNTTKNLETYLKSVNSQLNNISTQFENISIDFYKQITDLTTVVGQYDNISINFITQLNTLSSKFNNKIRKFGKVNLFITYIPFICN